MTEIDEEQWLPIPDYEGWYEASTLGRVRSVDRIIPVQTSRTKPYTIRCKSKILKPTVVNGYVNVCLWKQHIGSPERRSGVIARTFHGPRPDGMYVCHANGNSLDDRPSNLYYGTPKQNSDDKIAHGTHLQGEAIPWSVLSEDNIRFIRDNRGKIQQKDLANMFNVGQTQISRIQLRKQWTHVQ